ncbi:MAG: protein kinase, partial [Myxococcales bacterium]|nr:protein kinase [Myxococcales bacterium]
MATVKQDQKIRSFGRYQLDRVIGRGGMGEIYLASTEGLGGFRKEVAIKVILGHLSEEPEFVQRFIDEANIAVRLTHGNIVSVFDMGQAEGKVFIAMEYIPGRDLRDFLRTLSIRGHRLDPALALFIIGEVAKGLAHAHAKSENGEPLGIIHRDVSPSNVLLSHDGVVKLTDFGIAKAASRLGHSITGRLQGKFCYMSPEQASGRSVDFRSDLFSLAAVAYEALLGVRPFDDESDLATLDRVRDVDYAAPTAVDESMPAALDEVFERAFQADPEARYPDAVAFFRALQHAFGDLQPAAEAELSAALQKTYPEGVVAKTPVASGLGFDEILAMQAEQVLGSTPAGNTRTLTASAPGALLTPSIPGASYPGTTPSPSPLFTPEPPQSHPPAKSSRRTGWYGLGALLLMCGVGITSWQLFLRAGQIEVACNIDGAEVFVDNQLRGVCPVSLSLDPGTYRVSARAEDHDSAEQEVDVTSGSVAQVSLDLPIRVTILSTLRVEPSHARF